MKVILLVTLAACLFVATMAQDELENAEKSLESMHGMLGMY
jgi:hypothetical protein